MQEYRGDGEVKRAEMCMRALECAGVSDIEEVCEGESLRYVLMFVN